MASKDSQHIEVIRQFPVHSVGLVVRAQIWWNDEKHHAWHILLSLKYFLIIAGGNGQPIEIVVAGWVIHSLDIII